MNTEYNYKISQYDLVCETLGISKDASCGQTLYEKIIELENVTKQPVAKEEVNKMKILEGKFPENNDVGLYSLKAEYVQNADCCDNQDNIQSLHIETQNNGVDNFYIIKTERWAIDDSNDLVTVINDFKKRFNNNETKTQNNESIKEK